MPEPTTVSGTLAPRRKRSKPAGLAGRIAAVEHYDKQFALGLTVQQKADLVEYLKSL